MFKILNRKIKNKWLYISIIIFTIYILYNIYKFYKNTKYKKIILNNKNNEYLESKGRNSSNHIINNNFNNNFNNDNIKTKKTYIVNIKKYNPIVIKISNIIIGRYNIGKLEKNHSKIIINIIYQNVDKLINLKQINDSIIDLYKFNELLDKITLIISRILFRVVNDTLTKILIGQYIINKTNNNKEIDDVYLLFINISKNTRLSIDIRMNAIDILNLSNNKKYIEISKTLLQSVRNDTNNNYLNTTSLTFNNNLNRVVDNIKNKNINNTINTIQQTRINNVNNVNNVNNQPQLLVDRDGTTYPIPPDINIPPLPREFNEHQLVSVKKPVRSIYDDSQNVHNTTINKTTLDTASELVHKYNPENIRLEYIYYKTKSFSELTPEKIEKIEKSIHRINTDSSTFGGKGFTLYTIYQSLLNLIDKHPQKDDLNERLLDELIDMSDKCSTGHLSRLINVLQGFDTNLQVKVKININDEIYAKIKHLIEKEIINDENMDVIMEDMLSDKKIIYIKFVKKIIDNNIFEILKEYEKIDIQDITGYNNDNKYKKISEIVTDIIIISLDKYTGSKDNFNYLLNGKE